MDYAARLYSADNTPGVRRPPGGPLSSPVASPASPASPAWAAQLGARFGWTDSQTDRLAVVLGEDGPAWVKHIDAAAQTLSAVDAERISKLVFSVVADGFDRMSEDVRAFFGGLTQHDKGGLILHGYPDMIAVPSGKDRGTLDDLRAFVPKLVALGLRRLMLTPVNAHDFMDNGYSVRDPGAVCPLLGGNEAYERLLMGLVQERFELITDCIPNHHSFMHERAEALLAGDFRRLAEHVNWSGAVKVGEEHFDDRDWNVIVHTEPKLAGLVSKVWKIFPDSNPDNLVRVSIPVLGEWVEDDFAKLRAVASPFALDEAAQAEVRALFERHRSEVATDPEGRWRLPEEAAGALEAIQAANEERVLAKLRAARDSGETPMLEVDLFMSFMGGIQFDKNISHVEVLREELKAYVNSIVLGQAGTRIDAVIHADKVPGTTSINGPRTHALMTILASISEMLAPGRSLIPEAFLPTEVRQRDWLNPHLELADRVAPVMGNLALAFHSAIMNTSTMLREEATHWASYADAIDPNRRGDGLGYAVRLHDEALVEPDLLAELIADGKAVDPIDALEAQEAEALAAEGGPLSIDARVEALRRELQKGMLTVFAGRGLGDHPVVVLGGPERLAQSLALCFSGPDVPSVSYQALVGTGNNVEFALEEFRRRLEMQAERGQALDSRKAFDARDLGRGPIPMSRWEEALEEQHPPLMMAMAWNALREERPTLKAAPRALACSDPQVRLTAKGDLLFAFNFSRTEEKVVRVSKAELADVLGWTSALGSSLSDVLGPRLSAEDGARRVDITDLGDVIELRIPPTGTFLLEPS